MKSRHTYFGHLSLECLLLICVAASATKSRGVNRYLIFAELFFLNECYSALYCTYLLLVVKQVSVNIKFFIYKLESTKIPSPLQSDVILKTVEADILPWSL